MSRRKQEPWWNTDFGLKTQTELKTKIQTICNSPSNLDTALSDDDTVFLLKVLKRHHEFSYKIGSGIKHLEIRVNKEPGMRQTNGIWIVRLDDTSVDISWHEAIKPQGKPTDKQQASTAARFEIYPQIQEFKELNKMNIDTCELCQLHINKDEKVDIDHIILFETLFSNFLDKMNISYLDVAIDDLGIKSQFTDRTLASKWFTFHKEFATLRIVHHICNLKRSKK
jgi:hypothetical protein